MLDTGTAVVDDVVDIGTVVDVEVEPEPTDENDDTTTDDEVVGTAVDVLVDVTGTEVEVVLEVVLVVVLDVEDVEEVDVVEEVLVDDAGTLVVDVEDGTGTLDVDDVVLVDDVLDVVDVDVVLVDGKNAGSHTPGRSNVTDSTGPANDGGTTNNGTPTAAATSNATRDRKPLNITLKTIGNAQQRFTRHTTKPNENAKSRSTQPRDSKDGGGGGI